MSNPHKHASLIKAWADGAEIQIQEHWGLVDCYSPRWLDQLTYRVKPTEQDLVRSKPPVTRWIWLCRDNSGGTRHFFNIYRYYSEEEIAPIKAAGHIEVIRKLAHTAVECLND